MEVDLRFSLQNICALTGVSHQSIRMYEKQGVLPKIAQEGNGYRYYHYPDLQRVVFLRYYASLGIPIKAAAELINGVELDTLSTTLDHYEEDLRRQIRFQQAALESLELQREMLRELESYEERCRVTTRPALYRLRCAREGKLFTDPKATALMKEWAGLFPVTLLSGISQQDQPIRPDQVVDPGYVIRAEHAGLLSTTESPYIDYYPPVRCVRAILRISSGAKDFVSMGTFVQDYIREQGYRPTGDSVSVSIANKLRTPAHPEDPSDYVCGWTPIE